MRFSVTVMRCISRGIWKVRMRPMPKVSCIPLPVDGTLTFEGDAAAGGAHGAGNDVEEGGLARAVGADDAGDVAGFDFEGAMVQGADAAEVLDQVSRFEYGLRVGQAAAILPIRLGLRQL